MTYLTLYGYNFCWCVPTLRLKGEDGAGRPGRRRWPLG
jgi:hypothetical protein